MPELSIVPGLLEEDLKLHLLSGDGTDVTYTIVTSSARDFIRMSILEAVDRGVKATPEDIEALQGLDSQSSVWALMLGAKNLKLMIDNDVSAAAMRRAAVTALYWHIQNGELDTATRAWSGKAQTPSPTPTTPSGDPGAAASTPPKPTPTSTTTTPKDTSVPHPAGSPGPTSGNTST